MVVRAPDTALAFAALALSVLLDRVGAATRELSNLRDECSAPRPGPSPLQAQSLPQASLELERLGWLFGMLASELGSDVLFQRRERRGLEHALWLVNEILARDGIEATVPALPALDAAAEQGTAICAVVARCVHAAHVENARVPWSLGQVEGRTLLRFDVEPGELLARALNEGALRLAGARLHRGRGHAALELPESSSVWP